MELIRAADPEEGVAAADWLRELRKTISKKVDDRDLRMTALSSGHR